MRGELLCPLSCPLSFPSPALRERVAAQRRGEGLSLWHHPSPASLRSAPSPRCAGRGESGVCRIRRASRIVLSSSTRASSPACDGARAAPCLGALTEMRGAERREAHLDPRVRSVGAFCETRSPRGAPRAALSECFRIRLSLGPRLRVPVSPGPSASSSHRGRSTPRAESRSRPGAGVTNPDAQAPRNTGIACATPMPGSRDLISGRTSGPLRQTASPVDAPRRARPPE